MQTQAQFTDGQDIDFKHIFRLVVRNWLLIVIGLIIALIVAHLYVRYSQPRFRAAGTIIVKDENSNSLGADAVQLRGLDVFNRTSKNLSTEIEIIKSQLVVERAVKNMPFSLQVSYFANGRFKTADLYKTTPFIVAIDTLYPSGYEKPINVNVEKGEQLLVSYERNGEEVRQTCSFEQPFSNEFGRFTIRKNPTGTSFNTHENGYSFVIHYFGGLVGRYRGSINVDRASTETSILIISCEDQVAARAADFVNTLIDAYTNRGIDEKTKVATNTINFIDEQLQLIRDSLSLSEEDIENFKQEIGITNLDASYALQRFTDFDTRKLEIELVLQSLDSLRTHIQQGQEASLISTSDLGVSDPALSGTIAKINELEIQRNTLLADLTPRHPTIRSIDIKIEIARKELLENIGSFREALLNNLSTIGSTINKYNAKLAQVPTTERSFQGIQRNYSLNENIFLMLLQEKQRYSIAKAATIKDNVVLDYAGGGSLIKPKASLAYTVALFISLLSVLSFIFVRDLMDDTISDRAQVEKLTAVPVLGTISHARNTNASSLVVSGNPKSAVAEAFRSIRTNLQYLASDTETKVVVITSTISGEGKTFFSLNIASILAISEKKVLLIGLDLRKPKIHTELNIPSEVGISKVLIGKAEAKDVIFKTPVANLDVLPAGAIPPNPSELIMSSRMNQLMTELRAQYDYIIIDTPPVGLVTDALLAMKYADVNVYILRQHTSKRAYLEMVNKLYQDKTIKNLAIVLNDLQVNRTYGYYTGYGYRDGYGYGYGYYEEETRKKSVFSKLIERFRS